MHTNENSMSTTLPCSTWAGSLAVSQSDVPGREHNQIPLFIVDCMQQNIGIACDVYCALPCAAAKLCVGSARGAEGGRSVCLPPWQLVVELPQAHTGNKAGKQNTQTCVYIYDIAAVIMYHAWYVPLADQMLFLYREVFAFMVVARCCISRITYNIGRGGEGGFLACWA